MSNEKIKCTNIIASNILKLLLFFSFIMLASCATIYKSDFDIVQKMNALSTKQVSVVVDRIIKYYGYKCNRGCSEIAKRNYANSLGNISFHYIRSKRLIRIRHYVRRPEPNLFSFFTRNDAKHMKKIKTQIIAQLKELNSNIEVKIINPPKGISVIEY